MRRLLAENVVKLVVMAAVIDILYVLLRDFGLEVISQHASTITYARKLAFLVSLAGLLAAVFFWLAFGALAVRLDDLFWKRQDPTDGDGR
jgi:hypothetical protein